MCKQMNSKSFKIKLPNNSSLTNHIYIHIYSAIRRKLKPSSIVIINLFRRRMLFYSPSRQMTLSVRLEFAKQQMWIQAK